MHLLARLHRYLRARRIRKHYAWIKRNRVVFIKPQPDPRDWLGQFKRTLK
jgi:hypothetical protein